MWFIRLYFCILLIWGASSLPSSIGIVGLFGRDDNPIQELAFRYAVKSINNDDTTLPRSRLDPQIEKLPTDDSFHASKRVCSLLRSGVAGIFGPQLENTANHVQSICDAMEIPHIETRWDFKLTRDAYSINLYPHPSSLGEAYYDIIKSLDWKCFSILYDSTLGLVRLQSLLRNKDWTVNIHELDPTTKDWRPLLKKLKKGHETKFVIDVEQERLSQFVKQASEIGLYTHYHNYFFTSLDMHLVDMEDFKHGGSNVTTIRLFDPNKEEVTKLVDDWFYGERNKHSYIPPEMRKITTEAALMYDAVRLFARSLDDLDRAREVGISSLYCEGDKTWNHGNNLINYMKWYSSRSGETNDRHSTNYQDHTMSNENHGRPGMNMNMRIPYGMNENLYMSNLRGNSHPNNFQPYNVGNTVNISTLDQVQVFGLTGLIQFDTEGFRTDFELEICVLDSVLDAKPVGKWTKLGKAHISKNFLDDSVAIQKSLQNMTLIVTTVETRPYTMIRKVADHDEPLEGNDRFEGFCPDLIKNLSLILGFNYTFIVETNGDYGSKDPITGEWNGMIRQLIDHKADLAIVDFTITAERQEAIDFSMPFMNLGIAIIYKKAQRKPPSLLSFMSPFSIDLWIYMATAYLGVSILLFILARMSPSEWDSPYPCIQNPEELENSFTLQNSLWFIIGTFLCQGADIAPRAVSTRIVAGIWWFFTLIMISSYTANLAAFLTVERMDSPITGYEDLAAQSKIKYGSKRGGATSSFFKESQLDTHQKMWTAMNTGRPSVFTDTNEKGVDRVANANGLYAFLMESVSIEYEVQVRCDLTQVGGLIDSKSYGIALPPGSKYTGAISSTILRQREKGILQEFKKKWWISNRDRVSCTTENAEDAASSPELGLDNVGGIFVAMVAGSAIACLIACFEFIWKARKLAALEGDSFFSELWKELKFIARFGENEKKVRKYPPRTEPEAIDQLSTSNNYNLNNYGYGQK